MRAARDFEMYRVGGPRLSQCGSFSVADGKGGELRVIVGHGGGWDHVSVSRPDRCPTWNEMARIKKIFFKDDETVMELHVPAKEHINRHKTCLHLWRPQSQEEMNNVRAEFIAAGEPWEWGETAPTSIPMPLREMV